MIAQDIDLQASATEIRDAARGRFRSERCKRRFPSQPRFFHSANHLERDASLLFNMPDEGGAVARFARGAGGYGAIAGDAKLVHHLLEVAESFHTLFEEVFPETVAKEHALSEGQRQAFVVQRLDVQSRISARP